MLSKLPSQVVKWLEKGA
jgi:uncharacterized membrane protein